MNVTIVGGGLTGLTAAYYLGRAKPDWTITLYEQAPRFGGKIQTQRVDDFVVELGPDSYLGRKTEMTDLVYDLEGRRNVHLAHVAFAEHRLRVFKQNRELFEQPQDSCFVHDCPSTQVLRFICVDVHGPSRACVAI